MKTIDLKGGPFDGKAIEYSGPGAPAFIVALGHPERPVYKCACDQSCASKLETVDYIFSGYEDVLQANKGLLVTRMD